MTSSARAGAARRFQQLLSLAPALALAAFPAPARAVAGAVTNFTLMLPARDGVLLHTRFFLPAALAPGQRVGTVLIRTPYGVDAAGSAGELAAGYAGYGWAAVAQDERGRFASEGDYTMWRSSANDTFDLLAFVADQSWSNGRVAQTGTSANAIHGYVAPLAQPGPPPELKAQFNIVGNSVMHQTIFQGGAYRQGLITGWLDMIGEAAYADEVVAHEAFGDYWASTTQSAADSGEGTFALTNFPILHSAGFYDIFSTTQIKTFGGLQSFGGPLARGNQILVVEAGGHCAGGAISWPNASWAWGVANDFSIELFEVAIGAPVSAEDAVGASATAARPPAAARAALLRLLLDDQRRHKGLAPLGDGAEAANAGAEGVLRRLRGRVGGRGNLVAGSEDALIIWYILGPGTPGGAGNIWASAPAWPATNATRLYMHADASLQLLPPASAGSLAWTSDPEAPIPTLGGNNLILAPCGPQDQRPLEAQFASSMLLFRSEPLQDLVIVNGLIQAELWVSSTAADVDVAVKVNDVFPTGESMLVQDGITRMRWRGGPAATAPMAPMGGPGAVYNVSVEVGFMSYVFNQGHRIQVAVASSNAQRFSVNSQDRHPLVVNASGGVIASNRLSVGGATPSALVLPLLPPAALAEVAL